MAFFKFPCMPFYTGLWPLNAGKKTIDMVTFGKERKLAREFLEGSELLEVRDYNICFWGGTEVILLINQPVRDRINT